jgi:signal transduction histidine kinase
MNRGIAGECGRQVADHNGLVARSPRIKAGVPSYQMVQFPNERAIRAFIRNYSFNLIVCLAIALNKVHVADADGLPVTDVAQLVEAGAQNPTTSHAIHLEGTVLWANPLVGKFVLQDPSGAEELEMDLRGQPLQAGQRIRLDGQSTIASRGAGYQIGTVGPAVDDDGVHTMVEKSGAIYLQAGLHPFHLDWFNNHASYGLVVEYQGPDLPRQKIPDSALFHEQNGTNLVNGLDYACYEATGEVLPDFSALTPVKTGSVTHFDLSVIFRKELVGLEFSGFIQVPRDGPYTFYLTSDDGSKLFIDEQSLRLDVLGNTALPPPRRRVIEQTLSESGDYQRVEVEGKISFIGEEKNGWHMELTSDAGSLGIELADGSGISAADLLNKRVRVVGFCQSAYDANGEKIGGVLLVSGQNDITVIEPKAVVVKSPNGGVLPLLTTATEVHQLSREAAQQGYPVRIQGVVTCVQPERQAFTIQDATRGIYVVDSSESRSVSPKIGEYLEVQGKSDPSLFAPIVDADVVRDLGAGRLPQPVRPAWDQLMNGSLDGQYVELQGIVTTVSSNGVTLFTGNGLLKLQLRQAGAEDEDFERYEDAAVRIRGCLQASWDYVTHQVMVGEIRVYGAEISVDEPAPADLFSIPSKTVTELLQFNPQASMFQRVKVSGQIIHAEPPEYQLMNGANGLQFDLKKANPDLHVGDLAEVVGFPGLSGASPWLYEAVAQKTGTAPLPAPTKLQPDNLIRSVYDATLVTIDGALVSLRETTAGEVLEIRSGVHTFLAHLDTRSDLALSLQPGSRLELTGVYLGEGGDRAIGQDITSFELLLNSPDDIKILARPPWWTLERMLIIVGILICVLTAAALWITQLHRQVEQRTAELGAQIRQRQSVEHQRAMEQERARIAQDLHDELGSDITEISMLAARVKFGASPDEKRNQYLEQVREKATAMVSALDEIVWAMNPKHDSLASLVSYFCLYAERFLGLANIPWLLEDKPGASDHMVDSRHRHQLFLAFKEALTNVVRHSGATEVRLSLQVEDHHVRLTVADNGRGFSSELHTEEMDGVNNMRTRIEKLGGRFEISGSKGRGTVLRFYMPLSS